MKLLAMKWKFIGKLTLLSVLSTVAFPARILPADEPQRVVTPNFRMAEQYSSNYLRQFVYSTSVTPNFIDKTDEFWYSYKTSEGTKYWRVNPDKGTRLPLFDHIKLAAQLSQLTRQPVEPGQLSLTRLEVNAKDDTLKFVIEKTQYEYSLKSEELKSLGNASPAPSTPNMERGGRQRQEDQQERQQDRRDQQQDEQQDRQQDDQRERDEQRNDNQRLGTQRDQQGDQQATSSSGSQRNSDAHRNFSPDRKSYLFAKGHNLYFVQIPEVAKTETAASKENSPVEEKVKTEETKTEETKTDKVDADGSKNVESKDEAKGEQKPKFDPKWDELAIQLTTDGVDKYSFAGRMSSRRGSTQEIKDDTLTRPNVTWSDDSKSFYVTRSDSRGVQDLWVINSLSTPRPTLETYPYPMPGEESIRKTELYWFQIGNKSLSPIKKRWKDEFYSDLKFNEANDELRFLRRDRLLRNVEYCSLKLGSGEIKCLFEEGFDKSTIAPKGIRFLNNNKEMIWWSERSGWGHFYLYDADGKLKNAITSGPYFAERIVDLDEENRILYFTALGKEPGENLNIRHLYSVRLDGRDLKLLDPTNADHSSRLSPTKRFVIDNYSRVDLAPCSVLRDSNGVELMKLETCDLSRLEQVGWKMPETFIVKASDGVTDLFGNMYKPFNFDPNKKYPIITYVYPGPQQEGTRHTFSATAGEQQLAQIGFIVIQVGHRGGTPGRSKAYAGYGYFNLRDYALADKKAAIEQLAQRFPFVDAERVGMYGHSGGGFMTAAALMVPPYNDFFKAGFSTAGNHDNNIYNNAWSERWHGLKEVPADQKSDGAQVSSTAQVQQRSSPSDLRAVLDVEPEDFFNDYELAANESHLEFEKRLWGDSEPLPLWIREEMFEQEKQVQQTEVATQQQEQSTNSKSEVKTRFEITVPTNAELAGNLKHHLFLVHGELDNNVHPANTLRLVDALIKANKKFDMLYLPATRHGFGAYQPYVTQRMFEFFADRLMTDYAEEKKPATNK